METILTFLFVPILPHTVNLVACGVWMVIAGLGWLAVSE